MPHLFQQDAYYRVKRFHMVNAQTIEAGTLLRLRGIHEVCEDHVYYMRLLFDYLDGTGRNFLWDLSIPPDETTGIDFLEAIDAATVQKLSQASHPAQRTNMPAMHRNTVKPPAPHDQLAFSILVPGDFRNLPLPPEPTDFSNPAIMAPLAVFMAGYGAVLCSVSTRPAPGDGSLMEWVKLLAESQQGSTLQRLIPAQRWGTMVMEAQATQQSEAGEMIFRAFFLEDHGHLLNIAIMAPTAVWPSVEPTLMQMVDSFALETPHGSTRPIVPGGPVPPKARFQSESNQAASTRKNDQAAAAAAPQNPEKSTHAALIDLSAYALDDATALDPEDPINRRFREAGAGLVPNTLQRDARCTLIGAGALSAILPIPAGWHAVDDGRRTLLFDKGNKVQVNFTLIPINRRSPSDIFTEVIQDLAQSNPQVEHRLIDAQGMNIMAVRNIVIDGQSLHQGYVLKRHPMQENLAIKVRVTACEQDLPTAMNMLEQILGGMQFVG